MAPTAGHAAAGGHPDGRLVRGEQTRRTILRRSAEIASVEGVEGLSLGRLSTELRVSKSGVFAHFGSKEELQLATIRAAAELFVQQVMDEPHALPPGIGRVWQLAESWLDYARGSTFPGGCFFVGVASEFKSRPGRVRDEVAGTLAKWQAYCRRTVEAAQQAGELRAEVDPGQLAFELDAFERAAGIDAMLYDDPSVRQRARAAILDRLRAAASDPTLLPDRADPGPPPIRPAGIAG